MVPQFSVDMLKETLNDDDAADLAKRLWMSTANKGSTRTAVTVMCKFVEILQKADKMRRNVEIAQTRDDSQRLVSATAVKERHLETHLERVRCRLLFKVASAKKGKTGPQHETSSVKQDSACIRNEEPSRFNSFKGFDVSLSSCINSGVPMTILLFVLFGLLFHTIYALYF